MKKFFNIPNIISIIRILMIPFIIWFFLVQQFRVAALVIVILSGITDKLDGYFARKFNQVSESGKMLDPLADKLTQVALCAMMFVALSQSEQQWATFVAWVFVGYIAKEIFMLLFALTMLALKQRPAAAEFWGKLATVVFYVVMSLFILAAPEIGILDYHFGVAMPEMAANVLAVITLVLTIVAFLSYIPDTYRKLIKGAKGEKEVKGEE
ncbi:MAG: CDP-alcohol phosphatidyltransferase family protein [Oscillospiraceae bacterium]|nr:CDP-alcohol phosphatidyltransferase family protein [Oscillospiraceae bacterium]